jgi:phage terminase large subunit
LDTRPTLGPTLKAAQKLLDAHRAATSGGVEVLWQHLTEQDDDFELRVDSARRSLPHTRLLVVVCRPNAMESGAGIVAVPIPDKCFSVLHPARRARFKVLKGGRGSAKSWSIARALLVAALERPLSVLCCREIQSSIRASVHKVLRRQIEILGLSRFFHVDVRAITAYNGSTFDFEGLFANQDRIKSFEGVNVCWVEEAESISADSWEILEPTLREPGSFFCVNYNPDNADAPTHKMFAVAPRPDAAVDHVTFLDNPYATEPLRAAAEYMRSVDEDAYRHVWLGETRSHTDAQILRGKVVVEEFEPQAHFDGPYFGLDFGFSQDPTAGVRCYVADRVLYIEREAWGLRVDLDETPRLLDELGPEARTHIMRCDCARPESISHLTHHGYPNAVAAPKWQGSVEDGVAHLRQYEKIVIHPRCEHTLEESRLYSFKTDRLTGDVLPDILDKHNHCWDAVRYGLSPLIQARGPAALMAFYTTDVAKREAAQAAAAAGDAHHHVERTFLGLPAPSPPLLPFQRAKAEGGTVGDL